MDLVKEPLPPSLDDVRALGHLSPNGEQHRWLVLVVVSVAQLMVALDGTVVNIALPSAQRALHFTNSDRQWIVTTYALAFGSLLLLGGRLADRFGRKRVFVTGLIGFAIASAVGGASTGFIMLVAARACQGAFGALLAPAGLSLLTTTFPDEKDRGTAFGVYGAVGGSGGALGLLLGGVLTQYLSWRWCLYINLIFAAVGTTGALFLLRHHTNELRPRVDVRGAILVSSAMFCLVIGFSNADTYSWHSPSTWGFLAVSVGLLVMFFYSQTRVAHPMLPLRILLDRSRGASYAGIFLALAAISATFLFLTYYMQLTLKFSPVTTGFAFLPFLVMAMAAGMLSNVVLLPRYGPRFPVVLGMISGAVGMALLTRIGLHSNYFAVLFLPLVLVGLGLGLVVGPLNNTSTFRLPLGDAGVGAAMANTQQQVGLSIGTALLNTVAITATAGFVLAHTAQTHISSAAASKVLSLAADHGYVVAFWCSAATFIAGALICGSMFRSGSMASQSDRLPSPTSLT